MRRMAAVCSTRSAVKRSDSAIWEMLPALPERMKAPIPSCVGSAVQTASSPFERRSSAAALQTVLLPDPSIPSTAMKAPMPRRMVLCKKSFTPGGRHAS